MLSKSRIIWTGIRVGEAFDSSKLLFSNDLNRCVNFFENGGAFSIFQAFLAVFPLFILKDVKYLNGKNVDELIMP